MRRISDCGFQEPRVTPIGILIVAKNNESKSAIRISQSEIPSAEVM